MARNIRCRKVDMTASQFLRLRPLLDLVDAHADDRRKGMLLAQIGEYRTVWQEPGEGDFELHVSYIPPLPSLLIWCVVKLFYRQINRANGLALGHHGTRGEYR
jgi:hypothetical protein